MKREHAARGRTTETTTLQSRRRCVWTKADSSVTLFDDLGYGGK